MTHVDTIFTVYTGEHYIKDIFYRHSKVMYMHIYTYDILERLRTRKHATHAHTHARMHA